MVTLCLLGLAIVQSSAAVARVTDKGGLCGRGAGPQRGGGGCTCLLLGQWQGK